MPVTPTYPGVYIEEIPSGVRTITGVATSIAAFIGYFQRGPIDKAVQIFNMGDFSREFGSLDSQSEASYAIQQFFLNGGTEAWVVRTASKTITIPLKAASVEIQSSIGGSSALTVTAANPGDWGNYLRVSIDYKTSNPNELFNLAVAEYAPNNPAGPPVRTEVFRNLSMDSTRSDFVDTVVNDKNSGSKLVRVKANGSTFPVQNGTVSGDLSTFPTLTATLTDTTPAVNVTIGSVTGTAKF